MDSISMCSNSLYVKCGWKKQFEVAHTLNNEIGQGCTLRGGGRVERMRGGGINATTSRRTKDYRGSSKGNSDGDRECRALPSWDLAATALVLTAEAAAVLIADDAIGGNSGVVIVGSASLTAGGRVIN